MDGRCLLPAMVTAPYAYASEADGSLSLILSLLGPSPLSSALSFRVPLVV